MPYSAPAQATQTAAVIPTGNLRRWIEPWYVAYAILGALASGTAVILIPLAISNGGGSATQMRAAIAAQNVGALFAPFWGWISDRSKSYRSIFFGGFLLIAAGFVSFAPLKSLGFWLLGAFLIGFGTGASNTVASLFVVEFMPATEWGELEARRERQHARAPERLPQSAASRACQHARRHSLPGEVYER